jgi:hypothetical protein
LFVFFIVVQNAVPPTQAIDTFALWLWAGVVWRARYPDPEIKIDVESDQRSRE